MFTIAEYIEKLLYSHPEVIVPGLGRFTYTYHSASITPEGILPPGNKIVFESSAAYNDGLLIRTLIRERGLGYQEAARLIDEEIAQLEQQSKTSGQPVGFGSLGQLLKTESGWIFDEAPNAQVNAPYFGWSPVTLKPIEKTITQEPNVPQPNETKPDESIRISISKLLLRRVAAAAAVILLLMLISQPISHTKSHTDFAQLVYTEMFVSESIAAAKTEPEVSSANESFHPDSIADTGAEPQVAIVEKPVEVQIKPTDVQKKYAVIIASLPSRESAENQLALFRKKEGNAQLEIIEKDGKSRIAYALCSSSDEAYRTVQELKSKSIYPDAWVLPVKQ